eukprot:SAG11_NODE_13224_length_665_cov_0.825088_1_plen_137_part_10
MSTLSYSSPRLPAPRAALLWPAEAVKRIPSLTRFGSCDGGGRWRTVTDGATFGTFSFAQPIEFSGAKSQVARLMRRGATARGSAAAGWRSGEALSNQRSASRVGKAVYATGGACARRLQRRAGRRAHIEPEVLVRNI